MRVGSARGANRPLRGAASHICSLWTPIGSDFEITATRDGRDLHVPAPTPSSVPDALDLFPAAHRKSEKNQCHVQGGV